MSLRIASMASRSLSLVLGPWSLVLCCWFLLLGSLSALVWYWCSVFGFGLGSLAVKVALLLLRSEIANLRSQLSFTPQSYQRIDSRCSPRRDVARNKRHCRQQRC